MTQSPKSFNSLARALAYMRKHPDRYIFPIRAGAKFPPLLKDNLETNCSNDPKQIAKWAKDFPGANWGLAHRKSGVMVIDVDTNTAKGKIGADTFAELDMLWDFPETERTTTPSGGFHLVYEGWGDTPFIFTLGTGGLGPDIDTPNYSLIPGCVLADGMTYTSNDADTVACPKWVYDVINAAKTKNRRPRREGSGDPLPPELIKQALDVTPYVGGPEGLDDRREQEGWLNHMMSVHEAAGGDPEAMGFFISWSEADPEYTGGKYETITNRWESLSNEEGRPLRTRGSWFKTLAFFGNDDLLARMNPTNEFDAIDDADIAPPANVTPSGTDAEFEIIRKGYVYFGRQEVFFNLRDWEMWKPTAFDRYFAGVSVMGKETKNTPLSMHVLRNRLVPLYRSICFQPGNTRKNVNGGRFNMWVPSDIVPKKGDTTIIDVHMEYLFPDIEDRKHVLNWLAWVYRNQGKKPRHALLVHGEMTGTGKSFIASLMRRLLGKKLPNGIYANTTRIKGATLDAAHGGWEYGTKLLIIEEVRPGFGSSQAVVKGLHEVVSEDTLYVDLKNMQPEEIPNYIAAILFSNKANALTIENNERRYLIVTVDAAGKLMPKPKPYYKVLYDLLDDDKAMAAIAYQLANRDLEGYSGESAAPLTVAKTKMAEETRDELEVWFDEFKTKPPLSYQFVTLDEVLDVIPKLTASKTSNLRNRVIGLLRGQLNGESIEKVRLGGRKDAQPNLWYINKESSAPAKTDRRALHDKRIAYLYRGERGRLMAAEKIAKALEDAKTLAKVQAEFAEPVADELEDIM